MPATALKHLAKKAKISLDRAEHLWDKSKEIVDAEYPYDKKDERYWALRMGITKKMMGLGEQFSFSDFLAPQEAADGSELSSSRITCGKDEGCSKMITFKAFLEAEVKPFSAEKLEVNAELLSFIRKNCSKSIWMFDNATPIWRGERQAQALLGNDGVAVIDTTKSERSSQNTRNWYTLILDNHPEYKDYPKRSQSIICTTNYKHARSYARGRVMAVIPFDTAKIGWVNARDIWYLPVNFDGAETFKSMNDFFNNLESLGLSDTDWQSFIEFDRNLKSNETMRRIVSDELSTLGVDDDDLENWMDNFLSHVLEIYDDVNLDLYTPEQLVRYSKFFTKNFESSSKQFELWVGGKVLCLDEEVFVELCEAGI